MGIFRRRRLAQKFMRTKLVIWNVMIQGLSCIWAEGASNAANKMSTHLHKHIPNRGCMRHSHDAGDSHCCNGQPVCNQSHPNQDQGTDPMKLIGF